MRWLNKVSLPMLTSTVNIFGAGWLVGNPEGIMRLVVEGDYELALDHPRSGEYEGPLKSKFLSVSVTSFWAQRNCYSPLFLAKSNLL